MDKETLSNYGWIVICVMVLAVMLALASPFGNFVANAIKSTTQGLFDVNLNALDAAGIEMKEQEFENMLSGKDPALNPSGATIENNTYEYGDYIYTRVIVSGNMFGASTLDEAWEYVNASLAADGMSWQDLVDMYENEYGVTEDVIKAEFGLTPETFEPAVLGGWSVAINEKIKDRNQPSYGAILESINGVAITDMTDTFYNCINLVTAPAIPSSVTNMDSTFQSCTSLTDIPVLPSGVTNLTWTFYSCKSLTNVVIPNGITEIGQSMFYECDSLTSVSIPESVTIIGKHAFTRSGITNIILPKGVVEIRQSAFVGCTKLTEIVLPHNLKTIGHAAFMDCTNLTNIVFENTTGWTVTSMWDATRTYSIDANELQNNSTDLIRSTYRDYDWSCAN